jgi:hypothetical protein
MLFETYEVEAVKKSSVFEWHKWFKEGREVVEDTERSVQDLTEPTRIFGKCGMWRIQIDVKVSEQWLCN